MTTIRMGTVWDRTVDVLQGRSGILATLAALYIFLPSVVNGAVDAWAGPAPAPGIALVKGLVGLAMTVLLIQGLLAITAVASDPALDRSRASRLAAARLLPALGVIIVLLIAAAVAMLPLAAIVFSAGVRMTVAGRIDMSQASGGLALAAALYVLAALIVGLFVSAKLAPLIAVVLWEKRGMGAVPRAWRMTRGSAARLVGVILLYAIVVIVVMAATTSITGILARLVLGADADAGVSFVISLISAVVSAIATVVQGVFYAQFYVAAQGATDPSIGADVPPTA